jgi:hypothetical protein
MSLRRKENPQACDKEQKNFLAVALRTKIVYKHTGHNIKKIFQKTLLNFFRFVATLKGQKQPFFFFWIVN